MKYYIRTYGCQMNYNDSERIRKVFESFGLEMTEDPKEADYIVLNSCAVRKSAEQKLLGFGKQISEYKRQRKVKDPDSVYPYVFMTGCIIKSGINERVRGKSIKEIHAEWESIGWIDKVAPIKYIYRKIASQLNSDSEIQTKVNFDEIVHYLDIEPIAFSKITGSVPISSGCNHHCNFCTVPFSRGREEFRPFEKIKSEYIKLVEGNYKQITLLGQTVNKWLNPNLDYPTWAHGWYKSGHPSPKAKINSNNDPDNFTELLKELDSIAGDYQLNFVSSYPNYFNEELIDYVINSIKNGGHIAPVIHLAVQSGSNKVLESMARHHTVEEFKYIVNKFREAIPDISITTDVIVGYTGESEEDFQQTANLLREITFDMVYISEYSVRPDTPAEQLKDDVPKAEKKRRKEILNSILEEGLRHRNKLFVDKTVKVLVLDRLHNNLLGRSEYGKDVEIEGEFSNAEEYIGKFVNVKIESSTAWNMKGKMCFSL